MLEMEFFLTKFQTCYEEGLKARYPSERVSTVCTNKLIKFIRLNNDLL